MKILSGILGGLLLLASAAPGVEEVRVPSDQAATIAEALALEGVGTIILEPGVFLEHDLVVEGPVLLQGATGDPADVVIDAEGQGRVMTVLEHPGVLLEGITLRNGRALDADGRGGGILSFSQFLKLTDVRIEDCTAASGGGLHIHGPTLRTELVRTAVTGCTALVSGGGLFAANGAVQFECRETTFAGNAAGGSGGAMAAASTDLVCESVTMVANDAPHGSALALWKGADVELNRCLLALNTGGAAVLRDNSSLIDPYCCAIALNTGGDWTGPLAGLLGVDGNIAEDPQFCDPESGDWSVADSSPCAPAAACGGIGAWGADCGSTPNEPGDDGTPARLVEFAAFPNPFNPETEIVFSLASPGRVQLAVYDLAGRAVRTLVDGARPVGNHRAVWRGDDDSGRSVPSGVYLAVIRTDGRREALRLALVK